jgi:hypothetical protein
MIGTGRIMIIFGLEEFPHKSYFGTLKIIEEFIKMKMRIYNELAFGSVSRLGEEEEAVALNPH